MPTNCISVQLRFLIATITAFLFVTTTQSRIDAAEILPVVLWSFGEEEATPLISYGTVERDVPGPRPDKYPDFSSNNTAVRFDGNGSRYVLADPGVQSPFDFTNGDEITLEAWVQIDELQRGQNVYIIGKGRTGDKKFTPENQNWALRLHEMNGQACISFLFATPKVKGDLTSGVNYHRWTSDHGCRPGKAWHHIAVAYRFGTPTSLRAVIDGQVITGKWDMAGTTTNAPVVDNDAIWIASSMGGNSGSSLRGALDEIAIYRKALPVDLLKSHYRGPDQSVIPKPQPEVAPELGNLPKDSVLLTLHEGMPAHDRWLNEDETLPAESLRWEINGLMIDRLPQKFDNWGIRESWGAPVLARFAVDLTLPEGKHRFLLRTRGLSRLWVNGKVIARGDKMLGSPSGEEPMTPVPVPPLANLRRAEHRQQEVFAEAVVGADGKCRVILETLVGGKNFRADPGETCVAIETDQGKMFDVLTAAESKRISLTNEAFNAALAFQELEMRAFEDRRRREAAQTQDSFWSKRHQAARDWATQHVVPAISGSKQHPIDAFLKSKIDNAVAASAATPLEEARQFHRDILPILKDHCFRCHGEQENGGLLLTSRAGLLKAGDSGTPAIIPGNINDGEILHRIRATDPVERMPPGPTGLSESQIATLEKWIEQGAAWPAPPVTKEDVSPSAVVNDSAFVRRLFLDIVGENPTEEDVREFLANSSPEKRTQLIDRLLEDERWADRWLGYWQDVLAENPTLLNASLNTTGPFRWFLHDALRDNKPMDRLVTELILLKGSQHEGGSAGFGMASNNDAPFAAKGQIVASAFLGMELQCARCHDSPFHRTTQRDLYSLAAMFERKPVTVPPTSRVPHEFFEKKIRESLIKVTLKPDESITPTWPFADVTGCADDDSIASLMMNPNDTRERLAALITAPQNTRFAQVIVNRIWRQYLGAGLVEPPDDWEGHLPSHPELLAWLAQEFVTHNYDLKYLTRLILTSDVYQREAVGTNRTTSPELRFFVSPDRRRLSAEQIVDSLTLASGLQMDSEELTFDPDARRPANNRLTLGIPRRAWMFASLANERDRPSLSLPRARAYTDIMEAFGWSGSRQNPRTTRELSPNVLQPGVLGNSTASQLLTRASFQSGLAELAVSAPSPEDLVDSVFLRYLSRLPTELEREPFVAAIKIGFNTRLVPDNERPVIKEVEVFPKVTWSNHLRSEANSIAVELEQQARNGAPPDPRLRAEWREVYEDVVWSVLNLGEFVWIP